MEVRREVKGGRKIPGGEGGEKGWRREGKGRKEGGRRRERVRGGREGKRREQKEGERKQTILKAISHMQYTVAATAPSQ